MSYRTVEVEREDRRVRPRHSVALPAKAQALLLILEPSGDTPAPPPAASEAGLHRFLSTPDLALSPEQFRASMEADFFEQ